MTDKSDPEDNGLPSASNNPPNGEYELSMHQLLTIGSAACREIKRFQPDFVVILLHGGWPIYYAAHALWQRTEQAEFPPIFPINLGTEKKERYKAHRSVLPISYFHYFAGKNSDRGEIGYFLNWVAQQQDWIDWIRERAGKLGFDPAQVHRVLILDDTYFEGSTFYLAQQLFESSFASAEVHFLAGHMFDWRGELSKPWMEQHQVVLPEDPTRAIPNAIWCLATGSADVDPASFDWQPLHKDLPILQPLAPYLPLETWLELPGWIRTQIDLAAQEWALSHKKDEGYDWVWNHGFSAVDLLFRHLWRYGSIRSTEYALVARISLRKARQILRYNYEMGQLTLCGSGTTRHYQLSPRYDPQVRPDHKAMTTFWVCEGQLLSGDFPGWKEEEVIRECFAPFQALGLDLVVELDPDFEDLQEKIAAMGMQYLGIETAFELYSPQWIQKTIRKINGILQEQPVVYLTSSNDTVLGLILGCFLVERGMTGQAALRRLKQLRRSSTEPWLPFPSDLRARKMIKRWPLFQTYDHEQ